MARSLLSCAAVTLSEISETPGDQLQLRETANEIASAVDDRYVADRIREIFTHELA